jgi:hypothetical protein
MGQRTCASSVFVEKRDVRRPLGILGVDERIILKYVLNV